MGIVQWKISLYTLSPNTLRDTSVTHTSNFDLSGMFCCTKSVIIIICLCVYFWPEILITIWEFLDEFYTSLLGQRSARHTKHFSCVHKWSEHYSCIDDRRSYPQNCVLEHMYFHCPRSIIITIIVTKKKKKTKDMAKLMLLWCHWWAAWEIVIYNFVVCLYASRNVCAYTAHTYMYECILCSLDYYDEMRRHEKKQWCCALSMMPSHWTIIAMNFTSLNDHYGCLSMYNIGFASVYLQFLIH